MIVEFVEFWEFLSSATVRLLFFLCFLNLATLFFIARRAKKYKSVGGSFKGDYEVIIPLYREAPEVLEETLKSIDKGVRVTVICDADEDERIFKVCKKHGARVLASKRHLSKKEAIIWGIREAKAPFILQLDSDVRLKKSAVGELFKPFSDEKAGSVSPRNVIWKNSGNFAERYSESIEDGRHIVNSACDPVLAVVDGRGALYRKKALEEVLSDWENEKFEGRNIIKGEDGSLTRLLQSRGWKTKYQPKAILEIMPPPNTMSLIKQQLRWGQAGYFFFLRDIKRCSFRGKPFVYNFHMFAYFIFPILLVAALVYDIAFTPPFRISLPIFAFNCLFILPFGLGLWVLARRFIMRTKVRFRDMIPFGLFGFFIIFPLMLYSLMTCYKVESWGERAAWSANGGGKGVSPLAAFLVLFCLFSIVGSVILLYATSQRVVSY
jgi:cellulose synthase/poly-beta-1,6-N-acetylglucosamine synthase-like glycosyltransferase